MIDEIKNICANEMIELLKKSTITDASVQALCKFNDGNFCNEVDALCPVISAVVKAACGTSESSMHSSFHSQCYGVMFKCKFGTSKANVVTHRNDQLLMAAGAKKKAFSWFNKMGLTNSYTTALKKNKLFSEGHDELVSQWKKEIELLSGTDANPPEYQIVGENIDFEVTAKYQGTNRHNQSLHWFHYYAVKERVHSSQDTRELKEYENIPVLPSANMNVYKILLARTITSFLPSFKVFSKYVARHITHPFKKEMTSKSEVVPLGLIFEAENSSDGISKILGEIQDLYVPTQRDVIMVKSLMF